MAIGTTFETLTEMVRDEAKLSSNSSRGIDNLAYILRLIRRHYEQLYDAYDWPHMKLPKEQGRISTQAGQRYYDIPATLNAHRISKISAHVGYDWIELVYGVGPEQYAVIDPDRDMRADPALRWDFVGERSIEIWPMPASNNNLIWFEGYKDFTRLVEQSDRCDLDDILVSLFVAAEILSNSKDGQAKAQAAQMRLNQLRAGSRPKIRVGMGQGKPDTSTRRLPRIMVAEGQTNITTTNNGS